MLGLFLVFLGTTLGAVTIATAAPRRAEAETPAAGTAGPAAARLAKARAAAVAAANPTEAPTPAPSPSPPLVYFRDVPVAPALPLYGMASGVVVDLDRDQVLWAQNPDAARPTASLGKIFTVMVAMDHARIHQMVTVPPGGEDDNPDDSVMGLHVGDSISVRHLLEGIWLASGDDAAETLARSFIPRDRFIAEMNAKAAMLGLTSTHLANPTGLDDPGEYSSAYDLAVATGWLESHYGQAFALAGQSYIPLPPNWGHGEDLTLRTLNKLVDDYNDTGQPFPGITGLKTGETPNAGGCLIATATRGGHHLVAVVMDDSFFFSDAATLLDYGFSIDG